MSGTQKIRLVICGDGSVGKSCLSIRWISSVFVTDYDPTIENLYRKQVMHDGRITMVDLLDTAGQEEFGSMRDHYLRSGEGFLVVYAVTDRGTFHVACELYDAITRIKEQSKAPIVLVGNKCDLEDKRSVSTMEAQALAKTWQIPFFETSAQSGENVEEAFSAATAEAINARLIQDVASGDRDKKEKTKRACVIL